MESIRVFLRRSEANGLEQVDSMNQQGRTTRPAIIPRSRLPSLFRFSSLTTTNTAVTEWPTAEEQTPAVSNARAMPPNPRPSSSFYGPTPRTANFNDFDVPPMPDLGGCHWTNGPMNHPALAAANLASGVSQPAQARPQLFGEISPTEPEAVYMGEEPLHPTLRERGPSSTKNASSRSQGYSEKGNRSKSNKDEKKRHKEKTHTRQHAAHRGHDGKRRGAHSESTSSTRTSRRRHPKYFLGCFPWVRGRRLRAKIVHCAVSGLFLALLLAVFLALSVSNNMTDNGINIFVILVIFVAAAYFCYGIVRLCIMISGRRKSKGHRRKGSNISRKPIRVIRADDEETMGAKVVPPAYGVWRGSTRVDPEHVHVKQTVDAMPEMEAFRRDIEAEAEEHDKEEYVSDDDEKELSSTPVDAQRGKLRRPPSYIAEHSIDTVDGGRYPMPVHPLARGRAVMSGNWL